MLTPLNCITPCITSFKRPKYLKRAVQSCLEAGFPRIVVCSSGTPTDKISEYEEIFEPFRKTGMEILFYPLDGDRGCNELWLRCAYHSPTELMIVLHDDDYFHHDLGANLIQSGAVGMLNSGKVGLVSWRANAKTDEGVERHCVYFKSQTKQTSTAQLMKFIMQRRAGSLSPVVSVLRRGVLLSALKEAEAFFDTNPKCWHHSGMPYGTEIIAYQRHCEAFQDWFYIDRVLSYFGDWKGSGTIAAERDGTIANVVRGYDLARDYCRAHRGVGFGGSPRIIYVYDTYRPSEKENQMRYDWADGARKALFNMQRVIPCPVNSDRLARSGNDIGDTYLPYLRDLAMCGSSMAQREDIVVVANADVGPVIDLERRLTDAFTEPGKPRAVVLKRRTFEDGRWPKIPFIDIRNGKMDNGVDAFAFSRAWWDHNAHLFPDMLMGREGWDTVMRDLVAETQPAWPVELDSTLAHPDHEPAWRDGVNRTSLPGQRHNTTKAKAFYATRNGRYSQITTDEEQPLSEFGVKTIKNLLK